jgi:peptidyl-prolyl cis-trans isomerase SurA
MKGLYASLFLILSSAALHGQALFTYGPYQVGTAEFMNAYQKNNTGVDNVKAREDYLELYTRFKLKVREAYDMHLDTLPNQRADLQGFRRQIEGPYLTDNAELDRMTEEAFQRGQKDIRLSHILIPFRDNFATAPFDPTAPSSADSLRAADRMKQVRDRLAKGEDFGKLAAEFSGDPSARTNGGDLGYVTVFGLPYTLENAAYALKDGEVSAPVMTNAGYHFLKKTGERPAIGSVTAAQILISFEPNAGAPSRAATRKLADSLYQAIRGGSSFEALAKAYSNDRTTFMAGGQMPPITVGQYDPAFEQAVFGLKKDGDLASPVTTEYGVHILKRLSAIPVETDRAKALPGLRTRVNEDPRKERARGIFEQKVIVTTGMREAPVDRRALFQVTDSSLRAKKDITVGKLNARSALFTFPKKTVTVGDWLKYANAMYLNDNDVPKKYETYLVKFRNLSASGYFADHLEEYNAAYKAQLDEFREGNLLFEVMERKVWNKATSDPAALRKYYEANKSKYNWGPSVDAIMLSAIDSGSVVKARKDLLADPSRWKVLAEQSSGTLQTDSGRFEISQIRANDPSLIRPGYTSPVLINESDRSASLAIVLRAHPESAPRSYEEARGMVINDYQQVLEDQWVASLKKKYPVKLNGVEWAKVRK